MMKLEWLEYDDDFVPTVRKRSINTANDAQAALNEIKTHPHAEEAIIFTVTPDGGKGDREFTFHLNAARTLAYVYYSQGDLGIFESSGDQDSPEEFTFSGGSFAAGTGIPIPDLERSIIEFINTAQKPSAIAWGRNKLENAHPLTNKKGNLFS